LTSLCKIVFGVVLFVVVLAKAGSWIYKFARAYIEKIQRNQKIDYASLKKYII